MHRRRPPVPRAVGRPDAFVRPSSRPHRMRAGRAQRASEPTAPPRRIAEARSGRVARRHVGGRRPRGRRSPSAGCAVCVCAATTEVNAAAPATHLIALSVERVLRNRHEHERGRAEDGSLEDAPRAAERGERAGHDAEPPPRLAQARARARGRGGRPRRPLHGLSGRAPLEASSYTVPPVASCRVRTQLPSPGSYEITLAEVVVGDNIAVSSGGCRGVGAIAGRVLVEP